jgi:flagellar basal-body rod protein FlgG
MIDALYIAESGMNSQQKMIEVISNNIANVSTPGFKKTSATFADVVYQPTMGTSEGSAEIQGKGVAISQLQVDFRHGDLKQSGNPLDIAINGNGFIPVISASGEEAYSRGGRLKVDSQGYLATQQGYRLANDIQIPPETSDLTITANGTVLARVQGDSELIELGKLELVTFSNSSGLRQAEANVYQLTADAGDRSYTKPGERGAGQVIQGFIEMSNVSMNEEMVNLMLAQRSYQLNARLVQVSDQILDTINNIRR